MSTFLLRTKDSGYDDVCAHLPIKSRCITTIHVLYYQYIVIFIHIPVPECFLCRNPTIFHFYFGYRRYIGTKKEIMEDFYLSSSASTRVSLKAVYDGEAGLSKKRKQILMRVPNTDDCAEFALESITTKDIAYLSAATHHEFALFRGKKADVLFHGTNYHCNITNDMIELLKEELNHLF